MDLAYTEARRRFFQSLGVRATNEIVLTEGVVTYLTQYEAGILADDLAAIPVLRQWVVDIASPGLLPSWQERTRGQFSESVTPLQFAPENGPEFFHAHGWRALDVHSPLKTAGKLGRLPAPLRPMAELPEDPVRLGQLPWSGVCRMACPTAASD
jgi:hypothetical protein